jgi:5-methylcytosine-specific restriction endonuclease McrA
MRDRVPDGDLETLIDDAVTEKLERLESKRFGKTGAPRKTVADADPTPASRHIPAPVRRAVHERDEGRCTYQDASGRRCTARDRLEFHHHRRPFGRGGDHSIDNLRLMCRTHNRLLAEREYGKAKMAQHRRPGSQDGPPPETQDTAPGRPPAEQGRTGSDQAGGGPAGPDQTERGDRKHGLAVGTGPP